MKTIGLTGGIASGKSVIAARFAEAGIAVLDADRLVHRAIEPGGVAEEAVAQHFPDAVSDGRIDRARLGAIVFSDPDKLKELEALLHPLVRAEEERFIAEHKANGSKAVLLEIPLLFETGADVLCDAILAASAPEPLRIERAMKRPHMTEAKLEFILATQWRDTQRNAKATHVIDTSKGVEDTYQQVDALLEEWGIVG